MNFLLLRSGGKKICVAMYLRRRTRQRRLPLRNRRTKQRREKVNSKKRKRTSRSTNRSTKRTKSKSSSSSKVLINRAPLLILWVAVVAQREGYKFSEGLTFGKAVAAICGHARGKSIGLFKSGKPRGAVPSSRSKTEVKFKVMGMKIPGKVVDGGEVHAVKSGLEINPKVVNEYLKRSFGPDLARVKAALRKLAKRYSRQEIGKRGYLLYEMFRPRVPEGLKGWGAKGYLDLNTIKHCKL